MNSSSVRVPSELTSIAVKMSLERAEGSPDGRLPIPSSILYSDWKEGPQKMIGTKCFRNERSS